MTEIEVLMCRYALEALDELGAGLPEKPLMDQVERTSHRILTTMERGRILKHHEDEEWVYTYRDKYTDAVTYAISEQGRTAMLGM